MIKPSLVKRFQSTHPLRGATFLRIRSASMPAISIHAPLAGCDSLHKVFYHTKATISIHAPLAGCDRSISSHRLSILINFNPRTPCGVRRQCNSDRRKSQQFQSTHPLRGATRPKIPIAPPISNFNPRTPCGVRPMARRRRQQTPKFQSTHPLRGATIGNPRSLQTTSGISIHAPLAGCDKNQATTQPDKDKISIHAPLAGCDHGARACRKRRTADFNPRTPCGVRLVATIADPVTHKISIHAPLAGCDVALYAVCPLLSRFQSTHPLRGATAKMHKIFCAFCDNRQFYRVSPSGVPSVGALFTYSRGLQRAGAGANLPVNGCALGLRAKASAGARLPSELRKRSLFKSRRSLLAPVRAAVPFQCNSRQQRTESCPNFSA